MRDALIVGAGPVGLTMALACHRYGVSFRLIDKLPAPSGLSKALAVWSATIEMLDGLGVAGRFESRAIHGKGIKICRGTQQLLEVPAGIGLDTPFPGMLLLPQSETETILTEKLSELHGKVGRGIALVGLEQSADSVRAGLQAAGAPVEYESFRWVVACDGAHSTARHLLDAKFDGEALAQMFVLCDAEVEGEIAPDFAHLFWSMDGLLAVFPVTPGVWRIISPRSNPDDDSEPTLPEMQGFLDQRGSGGWTLRNPTWFSKFRISERKAAQYRHGRVLLAGDAAHIHSPAGGQGMNTGMQDAANLAWKLGLIASGLGDENLILDSYHAERSPVAAQVLRDSGRMIRMGFLNSLVLQFLRDTIVSIAGRFAKFQTLMMRALSGLDISYPPGALVSDDQAWHEDWRTHGFAPGHRMRDAPVLRREEKISLFKEIQSPFFTLLIFAGREPTAADVGRLETLQPVASRFENHVRVLRIWPGATPPSDAWLLDPDSSAHQKFGAVLPAFYLIRSDHYVALRSQPSEADVLLKWLENIACPSKSGHAS